MARSLSGVKDGQREKQLRSEGVGGRGGEGRQTICSIIAVPVGERDRDAVVKKLPKLEAEVFPKQVSGGGKHCLPH